MTYKYMFIRREIYEKASGKKLKKIEPLRK